MQSRVSSRTMCLFHIAMLEMAKFLISLYKSEVAERDDKIFRETSTGDLIEP